MFVEHLPPPWPTPTFTCAAVDAWSHCASFQTTQKRLLHFKQGKTLLLIQISLCVLIICPLSDQSSII